MKMLLPLIAGLLFVSTGLVHAVIGRLAHPQGSVPRYKTIYQRTSTGSVTISEVSPEGKFITLENTSSGPYRRNVNLDGWTLRRTVDGKRNYVFSFRNFILKASKNVKILARGSASEAGLNDLVFRDEDSWGVGSHVTTSLLNDKEEEKASHVQKTELIEPTSPIDAIRT